MIIATSHAKQPSFSGHSDLDHIARCLAKGAAVELYLTPKPGLVDLADCGSHPDLSLGIMEESVMLLHDYLQEIASALGSCADLPRLKKIGMAAETAMYERLGTNTHRGYIFLSGMFLTACSKAGIYDEQRLRSEIEKLAGEFFGGRSLPSSHGAEARTRFHTGGIVTEALSGYPSLFDHALPAYRSCLQSTGGVVHASFAMLARLMTVVDDTTALHRCGEDGLKRLREDGRELSRRIEKGRDYLGFLSGLNTRYRKMNLTMGGVADMLALAFGYLAAQGEVS